jgi:hypothetical protein
VALQLSPHFVAFIDILGFSEMVRTDCESSGPPRHLERLYESHTRASALLGKDIEAGLIQFSDSIVFSRPFDLPALAGFLRAVSALQRSFLLDGLLCRGGVTFGRHFVKDRFLFSKGLIDAYQLETSQARYPRVVVSENLLQLATPTVPLPELPVLREEDGIVFVDYLNPDSNASAEALVRSIESILESPSHSSPSVQEKLRWLARYSDYKLASKLSGPVFSPIAV